MVGIVAIYDGVVNCGICIRIVGHKPANHRANECILGHARATLRMRSEPCPKSPEPQRGTQHIQWFDYPQIPTNQQSVRSN